jgi:hypothetical protein
MHFSQVFPMKWKQEAPNTLITFMQEVGMPSMLHTDDEEESTQVNMAHLAQEFWHLLWRVHEEEKQCETST